MTASPSAPQATRWRIGADIGGTFTDLVALGPGARIVPVKVLSTPPQFGVGVVTAVGIALEQAAASPRAVGAVLHGTTVATNAILEMRGARTAVVTTQGFRDVVELGRLRRPTLYDLSWEKPTALAPRRYRFELDQRIAADGTVPRPVNDAHLCELADRIRDAGVESVAVCLLNSYVRPDVEQAVAGRLRELLPGVYVTASVDISPEMQEYERTSTAVVNAYVGPVVRNYVTELDASLKARGVDAPFLIMQSSGGLLEADAATQRPVQIIESGPAAGVIAAQKLAQHMGLPSVVAFDMGGTTAKATLIEDGEPLVANDYEVGGGMNVTRSLGKGAGYPVRVPSIDIAEVGAGGGSIVSTDAGGALHVGPESASANPGPACYGLGGEQPTLTDANVVLGYLNQQALAGGRVPIQAELAEKALSPVAEALGTDTQTLARGAFEVAISTMTRAVKAVTSERGRDPRDAVMVAFGGAGPLYAADLARALGIGTVLVPMYTGLFSSIGLLVADVERHSVVPYRNTLGDPARLAAELTAMGAAVRRELTTAATATTSDEITIEALLDMRYRGQRFDLRVPVPSLRPPGAPTDKPLDLDADCIIAARERFHDDHERTYGRRGSDDLVEIVNLRIRGRRRNDLGIEQALRLPEAETVRAGHRTCRFTTDRKTPVIGRRALPTSPIEGPLVIEDMDATTLVPPGAQAHRDGLNNIVITWPATAGAPGTEVLP